MLVVGALVSVALGLAVLVQERYPRAGDLTEGARQAERDFALNEENSIVKMTSGRVSCVPGVAELSNPENSLSHPEAVVPTSAAVPALPPETNSQDVPSNEGSWSQGNRQDAGRVIRSKTPRPRSRFFLRPRIFDMKMRLLALWHRSLLRSERSRTWTPFANSNKGQRKISYTVATNH